MGTTVFETLREAVQPLRGQRDDYDSLLAVVGESPIVLLGEASHGTHEFYEQRAEITKRLIVERGFQAVAVEADWPDADRVNRFVCGLSADAEAIEALRDFRRFPLWMWRNADILDFIGWLRTHNDRHPQAAKVGFYGLDLYSLYGSIEAVLRYLDRSDPDAAARARGRYACFEQFAEDPQHYGYAAEFGLTRSCEEEVVQQLVDMTHRALEEIRRDGYRTIEAVFSAEQNARVIKDAEAYYRSMFRGRIASWNLRDRHMADTLEALLTHLRRHHARPKAVVWAHNSHLGDARATTMAEAGELNVGQLVRERYGRDAVLVGFSTYTGTVTAASAWDAPPERKRVRPALESSYEALFHETEVPAFLVSLRSNPQAQILREPRLERAIGVIYLPETERMSHYFAAKLPEQFDVMLHFDETRAVEPLERTRGWDTGEAPDTYPTGV